MEQVTAELQRIERAVEHAFESVGYRESEGDLWLGNRLVRILSAVENIRRSLDSEATESRS